MIFRVGCFFVFLARVERIFAFTSFQRKKARSIAKKEAGGTWRSPPAYFLDSSVGSIAQSPFNKLPPERSEKSGVGGGDIKHDLSGEVPDAAGEATGAARLEVDFRHHLDRIYISYITHPDKVSVERITVPECEVRSSFFLARREIDREVKGDVEFAKSGEPVAAPIYNECAVRSRLNSVNCRIEALEEDQSVARRRGVSEGHRQQHHCRYDKGFHIWILISLVGYFLFPRVG